MTQITIDKNILLVEVPEKLQGFYILPAANNDNNGLLHRDFTGVIAIIPPGNWQFIGTTDSMTEEMAKLIAETHCIWREFWYKNYEDISDDPYTFETALESYQSWLRANSINDNIRYAILKLNP